MKTFLILGILLLAVGFGLAYAKSRPMTSLSDRGEKVYSVSIILGFLLVGAASIMHIKKTS